MNPKLKEINEIIAQCDRMMDVAQKIGYIKTNHEYYRIYCERIDNFCTVHNLKDRNYAPYAILCKYWTSSSDATLYPSEIAAIKHNLTLIKHTLFENDYEKIFISHREKDADQVQLNKLNSQSAGTPLFICLNYAAQDAVETFTGLLPPYSLPRKITYRFLQFGITPGGK